MDDDEEKIIKVLIVGGYGDGKSNIFNAISGKEYEEGLGPCGKGCIKKTIIIKSKKYNLIILDPCPGNEGSRSLSKNFMRDSHIFLVVHDITKDYYEEIYYYVDTIKEMCQNNHIICLFCNKKDLKHNEIDNKEIINYLKSNEIKIKYVSAKENPNEINFFLEELLLDYLEKSILKVKIPGRHPKENNKNYGYLLFKYLNY